MVVPSATMMMDTVVCNRTKSSNPDPTTPTDMEETKTTATINVSQMTSIELKISLISTWSVMNSQWTTIASPREAWANTTQKTSHSHSSTCIVTTSTTRKKIWVTTIKGMEVRDRVCITGDKEAMEVTTWRWISHNLLAASHRWVPIVLWVLAPNLLLLTTLLSSRAITQMQ